ncbi:MAG: hypothetical protein Q8N17_21290 [Burkholderiaceae bacterium]|nr:hypothetical protein [Burkholderiaceae bacterium]
MPHEHIPPVPEDEFQKNEDRRHSLHTQADADSGTFRLPFNPHEARLQAQLSQHSTKTMESTRPSLAQTQSLDRPAPNPLPSGIPPLAVRVRACCVDPVEGAFDLNLMDVEAVKESEISALRKIGAFALQLTLPAGLKVQPKWITCFTDLEVITIPDFRGDKLELDGFPLLREVRVSGPWLRTMVLPERSTVQICPGQLSERGIECIWKMNDDGRQVAEGRCHHPWVDSPKTSAYIDAMREDLKKFTKAEDVVRFLRAEIPHSCRPRSAFDMLVFANAEALPPYFGLIRDAVDGGKLPVASVPEVLACKDSTSALLPGSNVKQQRDQAVQAYEQGLLQLTMDGYLSKKGFENLMERIKPA